MIRSKSATAALAALLSASILAGPTASGQQQQPLPPMEVFSAADQAQDNYVRGNILFLAYHEVGHLLDDVLLKNDPRLNRLDAEEVADDIAVWLMLPDNDDPGANVDSNLDEELEAAMWGWLDSADEQDPMSRNPDYPDDEVRAATIACYLYGSDPQLYAEIGQMFRDAIASTDCSGEYQALRADLEASFQPFMGNQPGQNRGNIRVLPFGPARGELAEARAYLEETRILEEVAQDINSFLNLPNDVTLIARSCGGGAAQFLYSVSRRQITACYEAVSWLMGDAPSEVSERAQVGDDIGAGGGRAKGPPRTRPR